MFRQKMLSNFSVIGILGLAVTCLLLASCGGGGGGSTASTTTTMPTATVIRGTAQAPANSIARIDHDKPIMQAALDFIMPVADATVTGLSAVANATVELIRIDDNGNQVGAVLASTTTDASGAYSLDLPSGVTPSADLIVQIKDSTGTPVLRAVVSGDTVNIDPISQYILDTLISQPNLVLANINIATVQTLVDQVAALNISLDTSTTIADAEATLQSDSTVTSTVNQQVATVSSSAAIVGSWGHYSSQAGPGMLVFYPGGHYLNYSTNAQDCPNGSLEYGTYSYDGSTLTVTPANDNGPCGFSDSLASASYPVTLSNNNNQFDLTDPTTQQVAISVTRTWDGNANSISGAWDIRDSAGQPMGIVFDGGATGYYIQYQAPNADPGSCPNGGVEYGTYSYDGSTITGNVARDDNGSCGLGNGTGAFSLSTISVANNVMTGSGSASFAFDRVETSGNTQQTTSNAGSAIVGAWGDGSTAGMMVFYSSGYYLNYSVNATDCPSGGIESGTYTYDGSNLVVTPTSDQNGLCGLSSNGSQGTYQVSVSNFGNQIDITDNTQSTVSFPRVWNSDPNSIVGAWDVRNAADQPMGLIFYANGDYIQYQAPNADTACAAGGVEYGTYSYDGSTITGNATVDDNGSCGLGNGTGAFSLSTITVANNVMTGSGSASFAIDRVETSTK